MRWPGSVAPKILLLLVAINGLPYITTEEDVGCLFSDRLCLEDEWCYDDLAFGRCLKPAGDVDEDDLFRYTLEREGLHELSAELRRLFALGYRWSHGYTQCRLKAMLFAFKEGLTFEPDSCSHLSDNDLEGALKALEGQVELDPQEVAIIKYTPSVDDPHAAYADEVYYPPIRNRPQEDIREKILAPNAIDLDIPDPYADYTIVKRPMMAPRRRSNPVNYFDMMQFDPRRKKPKDSLEFLQEYGNNVPEDETVLSPKDVTELYPIIKFLNDMHLSPREIRQLLSPENDGKLRALLDRFDYGYPERDDIVENFLEREREPNIFPEERFTLTYNTPDNFRAGWESRDTIPKVSETDFPEPRVYYNENDDNDEEIREYGSGNIGNLDNIQNSDFVIPNNQEIFPEVKQQIGNDEDVHPAVYSEGGVVWSEPVRDKLKGITQEDLNRMDLQTLDKLLLEYDLGFKRPERLDVKKPGPPFDPQVAEVAEKAERSSHNNEDSTIISMKKNVLVSQPVTHSVDSVQVKIIFEDILKSGREAEIIYEFIKQRMLSQFNNNIVFESKLRSYGPHSILFRIILQLQDANVELRVQDVVELVSAYTDELKEEVYKFANVKINSIQFFSEDYVYLEFEKSVTSRRVGKAILKNITDMFALEPGTLSDVRVRSNFVVFKVNPSSNKLSGGDIATHIAYNLNYLKLLKDLGIYSIGLGDKDRIHFSVVMRPKPDQIIATMSKKGPPASHPRMSDLDSENSQDYVYVSFKSVLKLWKQGDNIIRNISQLLHLNPTTFTDGKVDPYMIVFKVKQPNSKGLNATEVARLIESIKDRLEGVEIISVGVGNKDRIQRIVSVPAPNENQFYIVIFMVCGILAACIIASVLLIFIRRHLKSRQKLQGLSRGDTEASKDYQDLCRSRMAAKPQPAGDTVHGRITSLSRESEQSPSSRSSTSSWSEEPALHNMDISTGHMVLSYMEDHLKNKDRLEQEWVALCAYVAEPCDTTISQKKDNKDNNRYQDVVPYDHARVVLNELSNANGSNYINASSITDHDPRNPAYIATQGPLPHTAPDFWQLIWEQGAVVIVMLTRLTEGGAAMCHRYWPEEGSELYHIYEVHLVSEHIWCDDYLVRSFYLKNVRTGETRTVTQFHFLSWPDGGVPSSTKALLEFRRKVNKSYRGRSCPIVVHCSDGAGRTGTYCLIDMVLSRMAKGAKEIDIAATLEHLRDQRPKMVATKQQFEFVLTAVAEEVHAILKALPSQPAQTQDKDK